MLFSKSSRRGPSPLQPTERRQPSRKLALSRNQIYQGLDSDLPDSRKVRNPFLWFTSSPVYGTLLQQPESSSTYLSLDLTSLSPPQESLPRLLGNILQGFRAQALGPTGRVCILTLLPTGFGTVSESCTSVMLQFPRGQCGAKACTHLRGSWRIRNKQRQ